MNSNECWKSYVNDVTKYIWLWSVLGSPPDVALQYYPSWPEPQLMEVQQRVSGVVVSSGTFSQARHFIQAGLSSIKSILVWTPIDGDSAKCWWSCDVNRFCFSGQFWNCSSVRCCGGFWDLQVGHFIHSGLKPSRGRYSRGCWCYLLLRYRQAETIMFWSGDRKFHSWWQMSRYFGALGPKQLTNLSSCNINNLTQQHWSNSLDSIQANTSQETLDHVIPGGVGDNDCGNSRFIRITFWKWWAEVLRLFQSLHHIYAHSVYLLCASTSRRTCKHLHSVYDTRNVY